MADIVQLEEKGTLLYPKTHTSAIDNFDITVVKKSGDEEIAGVKNFKDGIQIGGQQIGTHVGEWTDWNLGTNFQKYDDSTKYKPAWRIVTINGLKFLQSKGIIKWKDNGKGNALKAYTFVRHTNIMEFMYEMPLSCLEIGVVGNFSLGLDGGTSFNATGDWTGVRMSFFIPIF